LTLETSRRGGERALVLVVEDNREMNCFICESLVSDYRVAAAFDGREGLRQALELEPDLIITDLAMPEMSGEQLVHAIRSHRRLARTPVVLVTAQADDELRVRLLRDGAQDFVTKPFTSDELRARIANLIAARQALALQTRLAALLEQAPDGIFIADLDGRLAEVNSTGCRMLGYACEELVGKTIVDVLVPEDVERLVAARKLLLDGADHVAAWTLVRKDGTRLSVEVSAKLFSDGRLQGVVRDTSERHRAEQALRASEAKFSGLVSIAADAIISIDDEERIVIFNEGAEQIFGWKRQDILGKPLHLLIPERSRAAHRQHVQDFAAGSSKSRKMGERLELSGLRANGVEFPAEAAISKFDVGGTRLFTVVLRDISERTRAVAEERLLSDVSMILASTLDYEEILAKLAALVVGSLCDCCMVDLVANGHVRSLTVVHRDPGKAAVARALAQMPVDRRRPHLSSTALEERRPTLVTEVTPEYLAANTQSGEHLRALRELGATSLMSLPLVAHDRVLGALILVNTTRRYESRDLVFAQELAHRASLAVENARLYRSAQRATAARDDVLGVVAHDLRNPLNTILLQADLLGLSAREAEGPARAPADVIRNAAMRMNRLIQDLLDVASLDEGHLAIARDRVGSRDVVRDAVDAASPVAARSSLALSIEITTDLPDTWGDRGRILQVLDNLIGNAIKFTPSGGRITVGAAPRPGEVLFWVEDTGAGISAECAPHLFDRFWQADQADRRGAGLGLAIAKGIVDAHGGRIWVESAIGIGTTFCFTIPVAPMAQTSGAEPLPHHA
jgi:PAS domain S-box-containing protein